MQSFLPLAVDNGLDVIEVEAYTPGTVLTARDKIAGLVGRPTKCAELPLSFVWRRLESDRIGKWAEEEV